MSEPHKIKVYRAILKRDVRTFSDMVNLIVTLGYLRISRDRQIYKENFN
jgi:hypothetical protein